MKNNEAHIKRRIFLARTAKASAAIALMGTASALLYDKKGAPADPDGENIIQIPDFSTPPVEAKSIAIVKGDDRTKTLFAAIKLLGGIGRFIKKGDTVLIKPNVAFATPPMLNATANPQLVAQVVTLCFQAGAKSVIVADNPINDPASCFTVSGIAKEASKAGAKIMLPQPKFMRRTTVKNARLIRDWPIFYEPLKNADKVIGISPVKDHHRSGASMSMKNFYGLLAGPRNIFHQDINTIIAELALMIKPTLVILDGTVSMITNGPTGGSTADLKKTATLIASTDPVAADAFACSLLGLKPDDLPYIKLAQNLGAGTSDYKSLKPLTATVSQE
jgi:uncharacterized protein (DUF362 family)